MIRSVSSGYRPSVVRSAAVVTDGAAPQVASISTPSATVPGNSAMGVNSFMSTIWDSISGFCQSIFSSLSSTLKGWLGM